MPPAGFRADPDLRAVPRHPPQNARDHNKRVVECGAEKPDAAITPSAYIRPVVDLTTGHPYLRAKAEVEVTIAEHDSGDERVVAAVVEIEHFRDDAGR